MEGLLKFIKEQGGNDHNKCGNDHENLVGWKRRLKSRVEIIVTKEGGKVERIKLSGWTNSFPNFDRLKKLW